MTEGQLRRARKLIRRLCANYDEGNCLALDEGEGCVCVQSISYSLLCRYFKEAVLPADAELCAAIGQGAGELKRCRSCGKPFQARSNRACTVPGVPPLNSGRKPVNGCAATGGRCNAFGAGSPGISRHFRPCLCVAVCFPLNPSKPCLKPLQNQRQAVPVQQVYNSSIPKGSHS